VVGGGGGGTGMREIEDDNIELLVSDGLATIQVCAVHLEQQSLL
jgi:hypothetical protein